MARPNEEDAGRPLGRAHAFWCSLACIAAFGFCCCRAYFVTMRLRSMPASQEPGNRRACAVLLIVSISLVTISAPHAGLALTPAPVDFSIGRMTGFSSWRPYTNPNRLVSIGMNKGEVLAMPESRIMKSHTINHRRGGSSESRTGTIFAPGLIQKRPY